MQRRTIVALTVLALLVPVAAPAGPLRVHPTNPRYFTDGTGRAIYLTGSHTWQSLQDRGLDDPPRPFDYTAYLDLLARHGHNFIRLWAWEQAAFAPWTAETIRFAPLPFLRTGPGRALDGGPRFDLTRFDEAYFERLRGRVQAAGARGLYVAVMLFQGWSVEAKKPQGNPWRGHPMHARNNVNGLDGDADGDGQGREVHTLALPAVTAVQAAYVRKVVDTLNDLDNVLWEIGNESHAGSTAWQYAMIELIKRHEATRPRQHPVGMTAAWPGGDNRALFASPADWISPVHTAAEPYFTDPPAASGRKVVIADNDHLGGEGAGDWRWVWKTFLRGLHPIYMDRLAAEPVREGARRAMGQTLAYARRVDLAAMSPAGGLASSGFCLASPEAPRPEFLVYLPGGAGTVDVRGVRGPLTAEWLNPVTGVSYDGGTVAPGAIRSVRSPFAGGAVLYLRSPEALARR